MYNTGTHIVTRHDAVLANWICASLALAILVARLVTHWQQHRRLDNIAYIVLCSIMILISRTVCNVLILRFGTINTPGAENGSAIRTGSILVLGARVLVTTYYWLQSALLLLFYRKIMSHMPRIHNAIKLCWIVLLSTWLAVILATVLECRPISYYWTLTSAGPHQCTRAYGQILLQCVSNLAIDLLLLVISAPIIIQQARLFPRNLQLGCLYILGTFCIIVIGLKIDFIYRDGSVQQARSLWASVQVVVCTFVANMPSIYGAANNAKRHRQSIDSSYGRTRTSDRDHLNVTAHIFKPQVSHSETRVHEMISKPALARLGMT